MILWPFLSSFFSFFCFSGFFVIFLPNALYFERISEGVIEGGQTGETRNSDGYNADVDRNYNNDEHKKENYSKVHVKQELIDGRTSSLETYGSDVHSVVTINRQEIEDQQHTGIPVPAPITACIKNGIRSPSTSSGYTSEGQPIVNPVNSPMEIPTEWLKIGKICKNW